MDVFGRKFQQTLLYYDDVMVFKYYAYTVPFVRIIQR